MTGGAKTGNGAMVEKHRLKIVSDMTQIAVTVSRQMIFILTYGHNAIMTVVATSINTGMIKAAIQLQLQKTGGVMAIITFGRRFDVPGRFSDG